MKDDRAMTTAPASLLDFSSGASARRNPIRAAIAGKGAGLVYSGVLGRLSGHPRLHPCLCALSVPRRAWELRSALSRVQL